MNPRPDHSTTAGAAYLDLRELAAATNRPTDELHQLYALNTTGLQGCAQPI